MTAQRRAHPLRKGVCAGENHSVMKFQKIFQETFFHEKKKFHQSFMKFHETS
jgi:hypothetical protein